MILSSLSSNDGAVAPVRPSDSLTRKKLKGLIQSGVQDWVSDFWKEKIGHYVMQGDYMALLMEEGNCITWKSYLWDIPQEGGTEICHERRYKHAAYF